MLWTTPPRPLSEVSVFAEVAIVIGSQGYGAFESELRGRDAEPLARRPSHGKGLAIDGALVVVEMDNGAVGKRHLVRFHRAGSIVFARGESLWAGARSLARSRGSARSRGQDGPWSSRTALCWSRISRRGSGACVSAGRGSRARRRAR